MVKSLIISSLLVISSLSQAALCDGQKLEKGIIPLKPISCKVSEVSVDSYGTTVSEEIFDIKCGFKIKLSEVAALGKGQSGYVTSIRINDYSQTHVSQNTFKFNETSNGLAGVDQNGNFPFNSKQLSKLAADAGIIPSEIKTVSVYASDEADQIYIVILKSKTNKTLIKGTFVKDGEEAKLVSCK